MGLPTAVSAAAFGPIPSTAMLPPQPYWFPCLVQRYHLPQGLVQARGSWVLVSSRAPLRAAPAQQHHHRDVCVPSVLPSPQPPHLSCHLLCIAVGHAVLPGHHPPHREHRGPAEGEEVHRGLWAGRLRAAVDGGAPLLPGRRPCQTGSSAAHNPTHLTSAPGREGGSAALAGPTLQEVPRAPLLHTLLPALFFFYFLN